MLKRMNIESGTFKIHGNAYQKVSKRQIKRK